MEKPPFVRQRARPPGLPPGNTPGGFPPGGWPCVALCVALWNPPSPRNRRHVLGPVHDRYTTTRRSVHDRYTTAIQRAYAFSMVRGGSRGSDCASGRRHGTTGSQLRRVWKNNGSAVETEPHGEASTIGDEKTRYINRLARAALEREEQVREYWVRSRDVGQFPAYMHKEAAVASQARVWLRRFSTEPGDSLGNRGGSSENFPVLHRVSRCVAVTQSTYNRLTAVRIGSSPPAAQARKRMQPETGMRRARSAPPSTFGSMPCGAR